MRIRHVADVRRLGTCTKCGDLGMHGQGLVLIKFQEDSRGHKRNKIYAHPACISVEELLALPAEELGTVRLGDVPVKVVHRIVDELSKRREK